MTTVATSELRSTEFSTKAGNLIKSLDSAINFESNNLGKISGHADTHYAYSSCVKETVVKTTDYLWD